MFLIFIVSFISRVVYTKTTILANSTFLYNFEKKEDLEIRQSQGQIILSGTQTSDSGYSQYGQLYFDSPFSSATYQIEIKSGLKGNNRLTGMYLFFAPKRKMAYSTDYAAFYLYNSKVYENGKSHLSGLPYLKVGDQLKLHISHKTGKVIASVNSSKNITLF